MRRKGGKKRKLDQKREKSGRIQRTYARDDGTAYLQAQKRAFARRVGVTDHPDATAHPLDALWRRGDIDDGERQAGLRYRRLYRLCVPGPGLAQGHGQGSGAEPTAEQAEEFRAMQAILEPGALCEIIAVCAMDEWPGWIAGVRSGHDAARKVAFLGGIKALACGTYFPNGGKSRIVPLATSRSPR